MDSYTKTILLVFFMSSSVFCFSMDYSKDVSGNIIQFTWESGRTHKIEVSEKDYELFDNVIYKEHIFAVAIFDSPPPYNIVQFFLIGNSDTNRGKWALLHPEKNDPYTLVYILFLPVSLKTEIYDSLLNESAKMVDHIEFILNNNEDRY